MINTILLVWGAGIFVAIIWTTIWIVKQERKFRKLWEEAISNLDDAIAKLAASGKKGKVIWGEKDNGPSGS